MLQAVMEAVSYRFAAIYEQMSGVLAPGARIIAGGGGILHSPTWTQMMADVIGVPVLASAFAEASSRGAALLGLEALDSLPNLSATPSPTAAVNEPDPARADAYRRGRRRQEAFYRLLVAPGPRVPDG
jgi:gluconokinase